jgi:hypothetical protein
MGRNFLQGRPEAIMISESSANTRCACRNLVVIQ